MNAGSPRLANRGPDSHGRFSAIDGTSLYCEWYLPAETPRGVAVVMHGYGEHAGRYGEVARVLTDAGLSVLAYDARGHGRSDGQRGYVDGFRDYLADFEGAIEEAQRRNRAAFALDDALPVVLVAHSNGALVALRALADPRRAYPNVVGVVLSSPFLRLNVPVTRVKSALGRVAGRYAPKLSLPSELRIEALTHDQDKIAARRADPLCHDVATARWFTAAERAQSFVRHNIRRVTVPTLWLVAGGDRIADPEATRAVHTLLRAPSRYREFAGMHHEVFNEVDRERAFTLVREFLTERLQDLDM